MGITLRLSKLQILALVLFILFIIAISLVVLQAIMPSLWHALFSFSPAVQNRWH
jgi:hypothetical protein